LVSISAFAQKDESLTRNVKTRYYVQTTVNAGQQRSDTLTAEFFNQAQKAIKINHYQGNQVSEILTVDIDSKGLTRSMISKRTHSNLPDKTDYYYDKQGLVSMVIRHLYMGYNGVVKEFKADTTLLTYDSRKNRLSSTARRMQMVYVYDSANHLIREDVYEEKGGKYSRTIHRYQGNLLMENLGYWFDGKVYKRQNNCYDTAGHLTDIRDSANNWLQLTHFTYNALGQKSSETYEKTTNSRKNNTTFYNTFNTAGQLDTQTIHSDDINLSEIYSVRAQILKTGKLPYEMKVTYTYDQYGNRLRIAKETDGQLLGSIDFVMTYY
jgi:YD repeat-containing protein